MKNPIHVYWHNRTNNPGHENELSYIQRKMAYGYNILSKGNNEVEVKLTAYKKRAMTVCRHKGKWISKIIINGKPSQLTEIQVKTKEGNSLNVLYVTLVGKALADGTPQTERIYNK
jgi:YbbR domain-containing protein